MVYNKATSYGADLEIMKNRLYWKLVHAARIYYFMTIDRYLLQLMPHEMDGPNLAKNEREALAHPLLLVHRAIRGWELLCLIGLDCSERLAWLMGMTARLRDANSAERPSSHSWIRFLPKSLEGKSPTLPNQIIIGRRRRWGMKRIKQCASSYPIPPDQQIVTFFFDNCGRTNWPTLSNERFTQLYRNAPCPGGLGVKKVKLIESRKATSEKPRGFGEEWHHHSSKTLTDLEIAQRFFSFSQDKSQQFMIAWSVQNALPIAERMGRFARRILTHKRIRSVVFCIEMCSKIHPPYIIWPLTTTFKN